MTVADLSRPGPVPARPGVPALASDAVSVRFGGLMAVSGVSLSVPAGSVVGLVGPNGAGKSTLFGVLSGLVRPTTGRVLLDGEDITDAPPQTRAARGVARTFQHPELFAGLTVRDHLVLAHRVRHQKRRVWADLFTMGALRPTDRAETESVDALIDLLHLGPVADRMAVGIPLGYARLVELGRALASRPRILLLDEPSSGLDSAETDELEATLMQAARDRGMSVLLVEHDVEMVMRMCSTVHVLDFGTLISSGTPREVQADPKVRAAYLGEEPEAPPAGETGQSPAASGTPPAGSTGTPPVVSTGTQPGSTPPPGPGAPIPGGAITVEGLEVRYGEARALSGVSFTVAAGRALAVLGTNGAGKSSLARALSGLVVPSGGSVLLDGSRIDSWSADRIRRAGVVHLPEGRGVFRSLSVIENLKMAVSALPGPSRRDALDRAMDLFPVLGERRRQLAGSLSGGEQQMLSLARALATGPRVVIADEMSLGLAPLLVDMVFAGLAQARSMGVTVIMIEQYVHRALAFADDCLLLQRGAVAWSGPAEAARGELLSRYLGQAMATEA